MARKIFSTHTTTLGTSLTLTVPKGPTSTQNTLYRVLVSASGLLAGGLITITGLQDATVYVDASLSVVPIDFGDLGVPTETDTDIVLTVPGVLGINIAALMVAEVAE